MVPVRSLNLVTGPAEYPVTIADLKNTDFLKNVDIDFESLTFDKLIKESTQIAEAFTNRKLIAQTWKVTYDRAQTCVSFPFGNLITVNSVKIFKNDGSSVTEDVSKYAYTEGDGAKMWLKPNSSWTTTDRPYASFEIEFNCGWPDAASVPEDIKKGIMVLITSKYYDREDMKYGAVTYFSNRRIFTV